MNAWRQGALAALVILSSTMSFAGDDPAAQMAEARRLLTQGRFAEAADVFDGYIRKHAKGADLFAAYAGAFNARLRGGDDGGAQKAGKRLFKKYPVAKGTFPVLVTWIGRGWKIPKLATTYKVLHYWTFDRVDASRNPDLRLAFLDIIAKQHRRSDLVKEGGILYCRAWCHMTAGRHEEAIALGKKFLRSKPKESYLDYTRLVVAQSLLASEPPQLDEAKKLLRLVASNDKSSQQAKAKDLLAAAGAGPASIQITKGYPKPEGMGRIAVLTNLAKGHALRKAIGPWMEARKAEVVSFRGRDVLGAAPKLRKLGFEYIAVVVKPDDVDNDFQLAMLELSRVLDDDPMPDFYFGYLVARNADDLAALTARILEKEKAGGTVAKTIGLSRSGRETARLDFFLHYGHGTARSVVKGISAKGVAELQLPRMPVIVSGACFNGVCARTHERYILGNHHGKPDELAVDEVLSLAWIHAGATGLLAALDGDRGEMAGAEWEHFLEHAPPLGAVIGYQYRLVFTSLRESYKGFPRYTPGQVKDKSFYGVMLRGQTSRILISDPLYKPLHAPLSSPTTKTDVSRDADTGKITVRVEMLRHANGPFVNTLPTKAGTPFQETRLYARAALPRGFEGTLSFPKVDAGGVKLTKVQAKHEVWGGRRYVNVQAESADWKLTKKGRVTTFVFEPR